MNPSLQEAQNLLKIKTVYLKKSFIEISEDMATNDIGDTTVVVQSFKGVSKIRETFLEDDDKAWWEYCFYFEVGIRLVDEAEENTTPFVEIKATFGAKYESEKKLNQEQMEAFSEKNVCYHVWPYWREYVQSSCMRLNIEPIEVPFYVV